MFDLGALGEVSLIAIAILILFGPKEIPEIVRFFGKWVAKFRAFSRDIQSQIDRVIDESEIEAYKEKAEAPFRQEKEEITQHKSHLTHVSGETSLKIKHHGEER